MTTVAVLGLGYVGLPLVIEFGKTYRTIGFDISAKKVELCKKGIDPSKELSIEEMEATTFAEYSDDPAILNDADYIVVAVPTPVDKANVPDLSYLISASKMIGANLKRNATIIYESTVYPGATEEVCIPVIEEVSRYVWKEDFFIGYSPERINPGDKEHSLTNTMKIVSGDSQKTLDKVASLYETIVKPGVYKAASIKVAEAAKVIENTQRDSNISLMNELAIIFNKVGIDTKEVLEAAGTKWNFLKFSPGLVGGHCISVDPYYLTHKAEMLGYHPQVIHSGRRINDGMGKYIAEQTIKNMISAGHNIKNSNVIVLGITFKENCADIRNSQVINIIEELLSYGVHVHVHDPNAAADETFKAFGVKLKSWKELPKSDAIVSAVSHDYYLNLDGARISSKLVANGCFLDIKSAYDKELLESLGFNLWRL